jgi:hypothetical protein
MMSKTLGCLANELSAPREIKRRKGKVFKLVKKLGLRVLAPHDFIMQTGWCNLGIFFWGLCFVVGVLPDFLGRVETYWKMYFNCPNHLGTKSISQEFLQYLRNNFENDLIRTKVFLYRMKKLIQSKYFPLPI